MVGPQALSIARTATEKKEQSRYSEQGI